VGTNWSPARLLSLRPLRAIGTVSYGFYIWHPLAFAIVLYYGSQDGWSVWSEVVLGLALAASVTVLSWYLVERPFLMVKDHIRSRQEPGLQPSAGPAPG
jgi:peptidoglycan/LPS O-acetylase OafA/YrhL